MDRLQRVEGSGWLRALLSLLAWRPAQVPARAAASTVLGVTLLALGCWLGIDWLRAQPDPNFYPYGIANLAWYALGAIGIAALLARSSVPAISFGRVLIPVIAVAPITFVAFYLIQFHLEQPWAINAAVIAVCIYLYGYAARCLQALSGRWQWRALALGLLGSAGLVWASEAMLVAPDVWYSGAEQTTDRLDPVATESLLFSQSGRIDAAIARTAPSQPGVPHAFFVGVAGYAEQRVFAEEIKLAKRNIGERYGSTARSVLLINDRRSRDEYPLASPTAIRYALLQLAKRMNLNEDVLFLSLSSHGSQDGSFAITNGALPVHDLTAADLAAFLKESGIRWRVVIVSACYSGAFVEPLLAAGSAVITAAAADRTSFGCADDRDLTYFGEAFYRDALPTATSLASAVSAARAAIAAREKREGVTPSEPQSYFGAGIAARLEQLKPAAQ